MSSLFTQTLGLGVLIVTALVCTATLIFLVIEQTEQISSLQHSLYDICISSLADHIQGQPLESDSGVSEETT